MAKRLVIRRTYLPQVGIQQRKLPTYRFVHHTMIFKDKKRPENVVRRYLLSKPDNYLNPLTLYERLSVCEDSENHVLYRALFFENHTGEIQQNLWITDDNVRIIINQTTNQVVHLGM